jgi:hypothetical protein
MTIKEDDHSMSDSVCVVSHSNASMSAPDVTPAKADEFLLAAAAVHRHDARCRKGIAHPYERQQFVLPFPYLFALLLLPPPCYYHEQRFPH